MGVARLCHTLTQKRSAAWVSVLLTAVAEGLLQGPPGSRHVGFTRDNADKKKNKKPTNNNTHYVIRKGERENGAVV